MLTTLTHLHRLHDYERWANQRCLAALDSVPSANRSRAAYIRATQLLPHNTLARQVWLWRMVGTAYDNPRDWFPAWTIDQCQQQLAAVDAQWHAFLAVLTDAELARAIRYTSSEGIAYVSTVHDCITHVFNHATYHRGQLARLVHECEGQRATTDFIAFSRQPAP